MKPTDGANGSDVDLLAEVVVGRMPMKTTAELQNFVRKTISFSSRPSPKTVLLMEEELFAEKNLYGGDYMNQLMGTCTDHGYTTHGYGTDWTVDRLFDSKAEKWSGRTALLKINEGNFTMVNHLGHSKWSYNPPIHGGMDDTPVEKTWSSVRPEKLLLRGNHGLLQCKIPEPM